MANKKNSDKNTRKLTRVGKSSFSVTLPVDFVAKLKWKERQKLRVFLKGRSIVIRDWKK